MASSRLEVIKNVLKELNQPDWRLKQIKEGIFVNKIKKWQDMSSLSTQLRGQLIKNLGENTLTIKPSQVQKSTQATKVDISIECNERKIDNFIRFYLNYMMDKRLRVYI